MDSNFVYFLGCNYQWPCFLLNKKNSLQVKLVGNFN